KVFPDLLNQNFYAEKPNRIWCVDFTYLYLKDGKVRYNCTIIDLYDRSVIATVNGAHITTELALRALLIAVKRHKPAKGLILHSDQGSQFTSKEFVRSCEALFIQQSMSRTGCPYDNAPIERYFNTLKHEQIGHYRVCRTRRNDLYYDQERTCPHWLKELDIQMNIKEK